ncbi:uncharacterized protein LOC126882882 isoform X1 [Diabrotica virgifera virgifera]|uniref:Uncharacterized protein n=1 Tax=Diabrotica virgifera virgifera TaxID=50390 RepID=A0ABM5K145_DIAVI|nr:uncharacterized protein LOC126882882 isoform X1 [Diabrotica virgifera virgifera]
MKNIKIYTAVFVLSLAFNGLMAQSEEIFGQFEFIEYINSLFDNALDVIHQLLQENNAQLRNGVNNFVNFLKSVLPPLPSPLPSLPSLPDQMEISDALYKYVREILEYFSKVIPIAQKVLKDLPPMSLPDLPSTLDLEAINIVISPWLREHQGIIVIAILKIYSQVPPPPKMPELIVNVANDYIDLFSNLGDVSQTMVGILAQILVPAIPPDVQFLVNAAVSSLLPELSIGLPPAVILS